MPVELRILGDRGIVFVRYDGHAAVAETVRALEEYGTHPLAQPGQRHLVDLSRATSYEHDFIALMRMQAEKASLFTKGPDNALIVYFAPTKVAIDMAQVIRRSWEGLDRITLRVLPTEAECLEVLGQPERSFDELLSGADIA